MPPPTSSTTTSASKRGLAQQLTGRGFTEDNENLHGVEFEAPFSAESQNPPLTSERFSIDFSIELERQLESMEASPPTSPPVADTQGKTIIGDQPTTTNDPPDKELLDPDVLAHIITQLRQSLSEMTKERDDLVKMLAHATAQEADVKDALQLLSEKAAHAEEELGEAKKRIKEDEDQIAMLRTKVDESRRGLMRLQTENRRQSMTPLDLSRAASLTLPNFANPPSSKRASFTPLTGSRHGRMPSLSDSNLVSPDYNSPPNTYGEGGLSPNPPSGSRRISGLFAPVSPGIPDNEAEYAQSETLRNQVKSLKSELEGVKHDLAEANEAKEASETCAKALREFIAENNIGEMAVKLPPLPTMASDGQDATAAEPKKPGSAWGFKLWGSGSGGSSTSSASATIDGGGVSDPHGVATPPPISAAPSGTSAVPTSPVTGASTPTFPAPLSRKLTGLFSSRSSISSRGSSAQTKSQRGSGGVSASALIDRTNSTCSYSDVSSVVGPMTPASEGLKDGLGLGVVPGGGDIKKGQETPVMSLHEVALDNGLR